MSRRVLLDENLPHALRLLLTGHTVITTAYQGWAGKSNGALIAAAEEEAFDVMVTADQGVNYQQSLKGRKLAIVVISTNTKSVVLESALSILAAVNRALPGSFTFVDIGQ